MRLAEDVCNRHLADMTKAFVMSAFRGKAEANDQSGRHVSVDCLPVWLAR
jgi:hypothetical protein